MTTKTRIALDELRAAPWLADAVIQLLTIVFLGAIFLAPAQGQAPVLGGTCPPAVPEQCRSALPCPYPGVVATAAQQQAMLSAGGPWTLTSAVAGPPPGMAVQYATLLDWWRAAEGLPETNSALAWCRGPDRRLCAVLPDSAWPVVSRILKPMPRALAHSTCGEWTGQHSTSQKHWRTLYQGRETLAQWLALECFSPGGNGWIPDRRMEAAANCAAGGGVVPPPAPAPSPAPVPPPPAPVPVPALPPATPCPPERLANCAALKSPFGQSVCSGCPCPESMPPREKAWNCTPSSPSLPRLTCEQCKAISYTDVDCSVCPCQSELIDSAGHIHVKPGAFCNPVGVEPPPPVQTCIEYSATLYVPTIESTGRLELVLVSQGEGPCP